MNALLVAAALLLGAPAAASAATYKGKTDQGLTIQLKVTARVVTIKQLEVDYCDSRYDGYTGSAKLKSKGRFVMDVTAPNGSIAARGLIGRFLGSRVKGTYDFDRQDTADLACPGGGAVDEEISFTAKRSD